MLLTRSTALVLNKEVFTWPISGFLISLLQPGSGTNRKYIIIPQPGSAFPSLRPGKKPTSGLQNPCKSASDEDWPHLIEMRQATQETMPPNNDPLCPSLCDGEHYILVTTSTQALCIKPHVTI